MYLNLFLYRIWDKEAVVMNKYTPRRMRFFLHRLNRVVSWKWLFSEIYIQPMHQILNTVLTSNTLLNDLKCCWVGVCQNADQNITFWQNTILALSLFVSIGEFTRKPLCINLKYRFIKKLTERSVSAEPEFYSECRLWGYIILFSHYY